MSILSKLKPQLKPDSDIFLLQTNEHSLDNSFQFQLIQNFSPNKLICRKSLQIENYTNNSTKLSQHLNFTIITKRHNTIQSKGDPHSFNYKQNSQFFFEIEKLTKRRKIH